MYLKDKRCLVAIENSLSQSKVYQEIFKHYVFGLFQNRVMKLRNELLGHVSLFGFTFLCS